jgi:hypothetical protein
MPEFAALETVNVSATLLSAAIAYQNAHRKLHASLDGDGDPDLLQRLTDDLETHGKALVDLPCQALADVRFKAELIVNHADLLFQVREADDPDNDLLCALLRSMLQR